ncbi:MAG: hypothetical protein IT370_03960 [Deltaproteobacteria bacterium]|nr:hypothetical protein [Deltaproteobacteria bacterium]
MRRRAALLSALALLGLAALAGPTPAQARSRSAEVMQRRLRKLCGGGSARFGFGYGRVLDSDRAGGVGHLGSFGVGARGALGWRLAWGPAIDASVGWGYRSAFAYEFDLFPAAVAVRLGARGMLGLAAGGGLSAAYDRIPFSWQLPAEFWLEQDLGGRVRVALSGRASWLSDDARQDGSRFDRLAVDELSAQLGLRFGRRYHMMNTLVGSGYEVSLGYRELLGTRMLLVGFGFHLSGATR